MKKNFTKFFALLCLMVLGGVSSAWAGTTADLVTIDKNFTYYFDSEMTAAYSDGTLFGGNRFLSVGGNNYANNKQKTDDHLNCLRVKGFQLAVKIAPEATIIATGNIDSRRQYVIATSKSPSSTSALIAIGEEGGASVEYTNTTGSDQIIYIGGVNNGTVTGGDLFLGKVQVIKETTEPSISFLLNSYTISIGSPFTSPTATLENCGEATATYTSSNEEVATVNATTGELTLVAAGETTITASVTVDEVIYSASYTLTVKNVATLTYTLGESGALGSAPASVTVDAGTNVTIPRNTLAYLAGSTLTGWSDGTNTYKAGDVVALSENKTLTAVFVENTVVLSASDECSITWNFGNSNGVGNFAWQGNSGLVVTQANISGQVIDLKVDMDATNGKLNNVNRNDEWTQCNDGSVITIPAVKGMVVTVKTYGADTALSFNGESVAATGSAGNKITTFEYNGDESSVAISFAGASYLSYIKATYTVPGTITWMASSSVIATKTNLVDRDDIEFSFQGSDELTEITPSQWNKWDNPYLVPVRGANDLPKTSLADIYSDNMYNSTTPCFIVRATNPGMVTVYLADDNNNDKTYYVWDNTAATLTSGTASNRNIVKFNEVVFKAQAGHDYLIFMTGTGAGKIGGAKYAPSIVSEEVAISSVGWASYAPSMNVSIPEGVEAYYVSEQDGTIAQLEQITAGTTVPRNTGMLLKGEGSVLFAASSEKASAITNNLLIGTQENIATSSVSGTVYVLGCEDEKVGLYQYTGGTLAANKAYLVVSTGAATAPHFLSFGDDTTGINNAVVEKMQNGVIFNLAGQKVSENYKGIVIINGKKVVK